MRAQSNIDPYSTGATGTGPAASDETPYALAGARQVWYPSDGTLAQQLFAFEQTVTAQLGQLTMTECQVLLASFLQELVEHVRDFGALRAADARLFVEPEDFPDTLDFNGDRVRNVLVYLSMVLSELRNMPQDALAARRTNFVLWELASRDQTMNDAVRENLVALNIARLTGRPLPNIASRPLPRINDRAIFELPQDSRERQTGTGSVVTPTSGTLPPIPSRPTPGAYIPLVAGGAVQERSILPEQVQRQGVEKEDARNMLVAFVFAVLIVIAIVFLVNFLFHPTVPPPRETPPSATLKTTVRSINRHELA